MTSPRVWLATVLIAGVLLAAPAHADPSFSYATDKEREELAAASRVEWKASAQGGLIVTAGNSRITAVSGGLLASRRAGQNRLQLEAGMAYGRSSVFVAADDDMSGFIEPGEIERPTTTTNKGWAAKGRYDRFLTDLDSLYGAALASADEPAGKEIVAGGQLGYSRSLYKSAVHTLIAEAGYDFSYEDPVVGDGAGIHSGRLMAGYAGKLSDDTGLDASVETLLNVNSYDNGREIDSFEDTRLNTKVALTTKMFSDLSFRFSFESKYDNAPSPRPPFGGLAYAAGFVPLADELDTKVEASLILNFL